MVASNECGSKSKPGGGRSQGVTASGSKGLARAPIGSPKERPKTRWLRKLRAYSSFHGNLGTGWSTEKPVRIGPEGEGHPILTSITKRLLSPLSDSVASIPTQSLLRIHKPMSHSSSTGEAKATGDAQTDSTNPIPLGTASDLVYTNGSVVVRLHPP